MHFIEEELFNSNKEKVIAVMHIKKSLDLLGIYLQGFLYWFFKRRQPL